MQNGEHSSAIGRGIPDRHADRCIPLHALTISGGLQETSVRALPVADWLGPHSTARSTHGSAHTTLSLQYRASDMQRDFSALFTCKHVQIAWKGVEFVVLLL